MLALNRSKSQLLPGALPSAAVRNSSDVKSVVMKKWPRSTPNIYADRIQPNALRQLKERATFVLPDTKTAAKRENIPLSKPFAHAFGVRPSSTPSMSRVIWGLVLFSCSKPGLRIVAGK